MSPTKYLLAALLTGCLFASPPAHAQQAAPDEARRVDHDTVSKANEAPAVCSTSIPIVP